MGYRSILTASALLVLATAATASAQHRERPGARIGWTSKARVAFATKQFEKAAENFENTAPGFGPLSRRTGKLLDSIDMLANALNRHRPRPRRIERRYRMVQKNLDAVRTVFDRFDRRPALKKAMRRLNRAATRLNYNVNVKAIEYGAEALADSGQNMDRALRGPRLRWLGDMAGDIADSANTLRVVAEDKDMFVAAQEAFADTRAQYCSLEEALEQTLEDLHRPMMRKKLLRQARELQGGYTSLHEKYQGREVGQKGRFEDCGTRDFDGGGHRRPRNGGNH